jgi:hypothetical protein
MHAPGKPPSLAPAPTVHAVFHQPEGIEAFTSGDGPSPRHSKSQGQQKNRASSSVPLSDHCAETAAAPSHTSSSHITCHVQLPTLREHAPTLLYSPASAGSTTVHVRAQALPGPSQPWSRQNRRRTGALPALFGILYPLCGLCERHLCRTSALNACTHFQIRCTRRRGTVPSSLARQSVAG